MADERLAETIAKLNATIEPALERMGYELVHLELKRAGRGKMMLRVLIDFVGRDSYDPPQRGESGEPAPGELPPIDISDCIKVTKTLSPLLDVEDPIGSAYTFEVSSPGVNRPLTRPRHFELAVGKDVRVKTRVPVAGESFFIARLEEASEEGIALDVRGAQVSIPYRLISKANLEFKF